MARCITWLKWPVRLNPNGLIPPLPLPLVLFPPPPVLPLLPPLVPLPLVPLVLLSKVALLPPTKKWLHVLVLKNTTQALLLVF